MEAEFIAWLRERLPAHPRLRLGPGDDAALVRLAAGRECVATVDMISDGVDFDLASDGPRRVGRKALAVNLSDLAAMAARPAAALVALSLPRTNAMALAQELYEGLLPLAERYDVAIAGGDLQTWEGPLVICITALGEPTARGLLLRSGARAGDAIVVTGSLGGSILGKHLDFEPRIEEALLLAERYELHAGMDVSDGLSLDLSRLCQESGCGAVIDLEKVPISDAARALSARGDGRLARVSDPAEPRTEGLPEQTPLEHALADGEDFELLLAVPPEEAQRMCREQPLGVPLTVIGRFVPERGLWQQDACGRRPLPRRGYEH
jgi:thiamine-monophosphate kinase